MTTVADLAPFPQSYTRVAVQGTIVIDAETGRTLRRQRSAVLIDDVLWCIGDFRAGDAVYVVMLGTDGGQGVIATGIVRCAASELRQANGRAENDNSVVLIAERDVQLLWSSTN